MTTMTSRAMIAEGWKHFITEYGNPRVVAPDGQVYVRAVIGKPTLCMISDAGTKYLLRPVYRSGNSLLRLLRA